MIDFDSTVKPYLITGHDRPTTSILYIGSIITCMGGQEWDGSDNPIIPKDNNVIFFSNRPNLDVIGLYITGFNSFVKRVFFSFQIQISAAKNVTANISVEK